MKIYTQEIDIALQSPKRFWVAPYSDFKIGVKIVKNGVPVENKFTVFNGEIELTPDEDLVNGFTTFTLKSNGTGSVEYKVVVDGVGETIKITQITTDSTVFEVGAGGGDVPADVATQSWVESQISGFVTESDVNTAIGTATTDMATQTWVGGQISALVSGGGYGQAPKLSAMTAVYETDWATLSATTDANTFYVVLPDPV